MKRSEVSFTQLSVDLFCRQTDQWPSVKDRAQHLKMAKVRILQQNSRVSRVFLLLRQ